MEEPRRSLGSWKSLGPLAVAVAAALLVGGGLDVVQRHQSAADEERGATTAAESEPTTPRFVVAVAERGTALLVRDARTGENVGLPVAPPRGRSFQRVAAAEDGSYIVASYGDREVTFQRLHLDDDGNPKKLTDIPEAVVPGVSAAWSDMAVSHDGERVAYVTYQGTRGRVAVVPLRTGSTKEWTTTLSARVTSLSWSGSTLSFVWSPVRPGEESQRHQLRTLDTGGPGGDLRLSKAVMHLPEGFSRALLSKDGKSVVVGGVKGSDLTVQNYDLAGTAGKVLWRQKVKGDLTDLDAAHDGRSVLASAGDLYAKGMSAVPGQDLSDATW